MTKRLGFTLAEVLITLGIIGVVAAMTIPTLMNQTGQAEFKTGFKKMMSTLNQAVTMNVALEDTDFSALSVAGVAADTANMYNLFTTRMNVIRTATGSGTGTTGANIGSLGGANYTLFFNDGMAISYPQSTINCTQEKPCKAVVDVNGVKKPNKLTLCGATTSSTGASATENKGVECTANGDNLVVGDQFSIRMFDQQVLPNGNGARQVMFR